MSTRAPCGREPPVKKPMGASGGVAPDGDGPEAPSLVCDFNDQEVVPIGKTFEGVIKPYSLSNLSRGPSARGKEPGEPGRTSGVRIGVMSGAQLSKGAEALGASLSQFIEETLGTRRFSWTEVWLGPFRPQCVGA